jgi:O-antigen biosynthesis protein
MPIKKIPFGKALVLAPHPDDEVFGCGGAIIRHVQQGDQVKVVIVTKGDLPVTDNQKVKDYVDIRRQESMEAARILGYGKPAFLDYPDGKLEFETGLDKHLLEIIEDYTPRIIYLPSETEIHPDHIALHEAVVKALKKYKPEVDLFFYEIGETLQPNFHLDITDLQPALDQAIQCFPSQLEAQDYFKYIRALHTFRSMPLGGDVEFAEAYRRINSNILKTGDEIWLQKQNPTKGQISDNVDKEKFPLISVVVRTMNRPQLPEALESIAAQTYPNLEVIVVDARGEKPLQLGEACGRFPLRLISKERPLNRPEAANAGLNAIRGSYFCFLDEDDLMEPEHIGTLFQALKKSNATTAYGIIKKVDMASGNETMYDSDFDADQLLKENYIPNMACLYRADLLRAGCRFDVDFEIYEDWDFLIQAYHLGDFLFVPKLVGTYRDFQSSPIHGDMSEVLKYRRKIYLKWIPRISDQLFINLISTEKEVKDNRLIDENKRLLKENQILTAELKDAKADQNRTISEYMALKPTFSQRLGRKLKTIYRYGKAATNNVQRGIKSRAEEIRLLQNSDLFDAEFYLNNNPDVKNAGLDPVIHYLEFGGFEKRDPSEHFDSTFYLEEYPDVQEAAMNPLLHYLKYGKSENRLISKNKTVFPSFNRAAFTEQKFAELTGFLQSGEQIDLTCSNPGISVILVLYNKAELTLACLKSLQNKGDVPAEIIIVDNNSTDLTPELLDKIKVSKVVRNEENRHFLNACNQALEFVTTPYVLLLNNDTEIEHGALSIALNTLKGNEKYGAVGGKLIRHNGALQEAGNIIWKDGSCLSYGRDDDPDLPQYNFTRYVDYCSAAFLLTRTSLFKQRGGFDARFSPAYYEDTDYCLWLQEMGFQVVYDPNVVVKHFEYGSSSPESSTKLMEKNRLTFLDKHKNVLKNHFENHVSHILKARFAASQNNKKKILYVDDRVPHKNLGSGYPRSNTIAKVLVGLGYQLTIFPNTFPEEEPYDLTYRDINPFIEVAHGYGVKGFPAFMEARQDYYDVIWVSRPHNMRFLKETLFKPGRQYKVIYDAEAIFAERDFHRLELKGEANNEETIDLAIRQEISLTAQADLVIAVSDRDAETFKAHGVENVQVLGHHIEPNPGTLDFGDRKDLLFVGNLDHVDSPNTDSILWFVNEVFPLITARIPGIRLHIVGSASPELIRRLNNRNVLLYGQVPELTHFYNSCRVFVAPTRFAAGIPYKIHEAASFGLPVVATNLLAEQLSWKDHEYLLAAQAKPESFSAAVTQIYSDETLWHNIRENALNEIRLHYGADGYGKVIQEAAETGTNHSTKVEKYWSEIDAEEQYRSDVYWMANKYVHDYYQKVATAGKDNLHWINYLVEKYFPNGCERMLSVGCGDGELERHLYQLNAFKSMEGLDISTARIEKAASLAHDQNCANIEYRVRDVEGEGLPDKKYDAVFFNSSLHHFEGIDALLAQTAKRLKPDGFLVLYEYVGPNRLEYTEQEKAILRELFDEIPEKYRVSRSRENYGKLIRSPLFFDPVEVARADPSEAINSEAIIPAVHKHFNVVEYNKIGGTVLHVLLQNIAGHFQEDDKESMEVLNFLFEKEKALIHQGELPNHFALIVAKRPQ